MTDVFFRESKVDRITGEVMSDRSFKSSSTTTHRFTPHVAHATAICRVLHTNGRDPAGGSTFVKLSGDDYRCVVRVVKREYVFDSAVPGRAGGRTTGAWAAVNLGTCRLRLISLIVSLINGVGSILHFTS